MYGHYGATVFSSGLLDLGVEDFTTMNDGRCKLFAAALILIGKMRWSITNEHRS